MHPDGQLWLIEWRGLRSTVADAKGVRDLAVLLSRPGQAVLELVAAAGGPPAAAAGTDLCPVLDDQTRRSYRRRLAKLDQEFNALPWLAGSLAACSSGETAASNANADADLDRAEPSGYIGQDADVR